MSISGSDVNINVENFTASGDNIYISSSNFLLEDGNVTLDGNITATTGNIGGFTITDTAISESTNSLVLKSNGQITASNAIIKGDITCNNLNATGSGIIGGFTIGPNNLSTTGFTIGDYSQPYVLSSSNFQVDQLGNLTASNAWLSGEISSSIGNIGG